VRSCACAVPGATPLKQLIQDIMILAHSKGYDVFNALDLLEVCPWRLRACVHMVVCVRARVFATVRSICARC